MTGVLGQLLSRQDWVSEAECARRPDVDFFPEDEMGRNEAKAVCFTCPVRKECLQYALRLPALYGGDGGGIWGGTSAAERDRMHRPRH